MWLLLTRRFRRLALVLLLLPLVAAVLSRLGRYLEHRAGGPTRTSQGMLALSRFVRRRSARNDTDQS
jgi:hypothetical protein